MDSPRLHRQRLVFLVAVAVIALHVLDDSFIQPEPGTSAGDHLVSGLVPLAALGIAAVAYGRIAPAWRAALALVIGLFGIMAGLEGWHYTMKVGASGDDYTGLLALPAGVVLVLLGLVSLWRSRRTEGTRARRYLRRALVGAAGLIVLIALVAPFMMAYGYTHLGRAVVPDPKLGGADYENVKFETGDGLELEGWYIPSKNGAAVIAFPGRSGPRKPARFLARHGYGVLLFDRRGEGDSEGDPNSLGWGGTKDLEAAVAFLRERPDVDPDRIGGIGRSVGGEMLLQFAAESDDLKAVVSEGAGIRSVREASESSGAEKWAGLPTWARHHRGHRDLLEPQPAAEPEGPGEPHRARGGVLHLRRSGPGRREPLRGLPRGRRAAKAAVEDRQHPRGRLRRRATGVRAEGGPLLQ